ncbi:MAG: hypothetical protein RLO18_33890, partial [Gimesia chilikensis]
MRIGNYVIRAAWGHIAFATSLMAIAGIYMQDVLSVSMRINNVILITPTVILLFVLYLSLLVTEIHIQRADTAVQEVAKTEPEKTVYEKQRNARLILLKTVAIMIGLGGYVFIYPLIGLDVATLLFMLFTLLVQGERRLSILGFYAVAFTAIVVGGARALLS